MVRFIVNVLKAQGIVADCGESLECRAVKLLTTIMILLIAGFVLEALKVWALL